LQDLALAESLIKFFKVSDVTSYSVFITGKCCSMYLRPPK